MTQPLTSIGFALIALASVLTGDFRRYGNVTRPAAAVGVLVGLLALGLTVASIATRNTNMMPLVWLNAILPGLAAAAAMFIEWPARMPASPVGVAQA